MKVLLALLGLVLVASALPQGDRLVDPSELALVLNEEEFEDYLDEWLAQEYKNRSLSEQGGLDVRGGLRSDGCEIRVNGDLGQPQPVYIHRGDYMRPSGNSGRIHLEAGEQVVIACTGNGRTIAHPQLSTTTSVGTATCHSGSRITGNGWLSDDGEFGDLRCSTHSYHDAEYTNQRCYNDNVVIRIGFYVNNQFFPLYWSCYDTSRFEVLYVWYEQRPENSVHQTGVDRPSWLAGSFFPGVGINNLYTQVQQKLTIASIVGDELADKYVTTVQFLSRGHLAAKTDFIYATGQRASFWFINAAPQWQPFNGGNWDRLEQTLRARIGAAGYETIIYTGTYGVTQLRNQTGHLVDIYLHRDVNNNPQLPVPLYYYKVVYEPTLRIGTAFVSINNPYYTEEEVKELTFCTDHCRNNSNFSWLNWRIDNIDVGYSFCCEVEDFRRTVPHLPAFTTNGLLY